MPPCALLAPACHGPNQHRLRSRSSPAGAPNTTRARQRHSPGPTKPYTGQVTATPRASTLSFGTSSQRWAANCVLQCAENSNPARPALTPRWSPMAFLAGSNDQRSRDQMTTGQVTATPRACTFIWHLLPSIGPRKLRVPARTHRIHPGLALTLQGTRDRFTTGQVTATPRARTLLFGTSSRRWGQRTARSQLAEMDSARPALTDSCPPSCLLCGLERSTFVGRNYRFRATHGCGGRRGRARVRGPDRRDSWPGPGPCTSRRRCGGTR